MDSRSRSDPDDLYEIPAAQNGNIYAECVDSYHRVTDYSFHV